MILSEQNDVGLKLHNVSQGYVMKKLLALLIGIGRWVIDCVMYAIALLIDANRRKCLEITQKQLLMLMKRGVRVIYAGSLRYHSQISTTLRWIICLSPSLGYIHWRLWSNRTKSLIMQFVAGIPNIKDTYTPATCIRPESFFHCHLPEYRCLLQENSGANQRAQYSTTRIESSLLLN